MSAKSPGEAKPPSAPKDWQNASWKSFEALADANKDWFEHLADMVPNVTDWRPGTRGVTSKQAYVAYVFLFAQLRHWKRKGEIYEAHIEKYGLSAAASEAIIKDGLRWHDKQVDLERKNPVFGGFITEGYDWLSNRHLGPELRRAFGYRRAAFQNLRTAARIPPGHKGGRARAFTFNQMIALLLARFARTPAKRRAKTAETIWKQIEFSVDERKAILQKLLRGFGAICENPPSLGSIAP
jgi:hypothetical protein